MTPAEIIALITVAVGMTVAIVLSVVAFTRSASGSLGELLEAARSSLSLSNLLRDAMLKDMAEMRGELAEYKKLNDSSSALIIQLTEKISLLQSSVRGLVEQLKRLQIAPECSDEILGLIGEE